VLGIPRSEFARLEQAMDAGVARQLALLKINGVAGNVVESVAKYNDIKISVRKNLSGFKFNLTCHIPSQASPISSNKSASVEEDSENWPELIALLPHKEANNGQDRIKWAEFARAKS
jgi:hypothetical protein